MPAPPLSADFGIAVAVRRGSRDAEGRNAEGRATSVTSRWVLWEVLTGQRPPVSRASSADFDLCWPDGSIGAAAGDTSGFGYESVAELSARFARGHGDVQSDRQTPLRSPRPSAGIVNWPPPPAAARQLAMTTSAGVNPYRGLRPFDEADAAGFHGRDGAVNNLVEHVAAPPRS